MADLKLQDFDKILNWRLLAGSHAFPGPDGGTCINEAAIVAAGFKYRKVRGPHDLPACFCPVLGGFAILVNDQLDDRSRRDLMPLVVRLAGSRDAEDWVMRARADFIMREVSRTLIDPMPDFYSRQLSYAGGGAAVEFRDALEIARRAVASEPALAVARFGRALKCLHELLRHFGPFAYMPPESAELRTTILSITAESTIERRDVYAELVWRTAAQALHRAFRIGTQAPAADTAQVVARMDAARKARQPRRAKKVAALV